MKYELCIYSGGTAVLLDDQGETLWASDADDDFAREFEDVLTYEDGDDIAQYLEDEGYLPADCALDIVEADVSGDDTGQFELEELADDDDDDAEDDA